MILFNKFTINVSSWSTLLFRTHKTHVVIGVRLIEEDAIVTFVEQKNGIFSRCQLVLLGKRSSGRNTKIGSVFIVCDDTPELAL
jgi:hypothetical protein